MLIQGDDISELRLALQHRISGRAALAPFFLLPVCVPVVIGMLQGGAGLVLVSLVALLLSMLSFSMLHKWQRPERPTWLPNPRLHWLVLETQGVSLSLSGLRSAFRVINREVDLAGLEVTLSHQGQVLTASAPVEASASDKKKVWSLRLRPRDGEPVPLLPIEATDAEARTLDRLLQDKIAWAAEREGRRESEVPSALRRGMHATTATLPPG